MTTIPTGHAVRVSGEPHNSNIDDLPVHFRSIQAPYSVRDVDDRCSVYSTLNTKDVEAMLSKGLDRFYEKFKNLSKRVNVHLPTPEVRFHDLSYSVECNIEKTKSVTVGGQLLSFLTPFTKKKSVNRTILHPMSGIIKPGTMTLVLGGPSSGKSTLLKALANKLRTSSRSEMQGSVQYSGLSADQIELNKLVGLVDQNDTHTATLTVRETFQFADTCLNGKVENQPEQLKEVAALRTELILHLLGMVRCAETVVGDALLRGVSGGERKRVTIGEVLVGGQSVFVCDEISTGLDSATTFDIMDSIRTWTKTLGGTAIVALLQPPPEVVELFDDILLMEQGHLVYHGPRENILSYFQSIGFSCPIKIDPADFLIDVISGRGYQYRNGEVSEQDLPLSINDFERCFRESSLFKEESKALSAGYQLPTTYETAEQFKQFKSVANLAQTKKEGGTTFGLSWMDELKLLTKRESTIYVRDKPLVYGKMMEAIVVGLLLGSIYYKADASLFLRMVFFNIAIFQRQAWQQLAVAFGLRAVFYKQRSRNFFRTSTYCVASSLVQIPINIMVSFTMCVIFYFMSGLYLNAGTFFVYLLILIAFQHAIGAYFTFLTTISPSITVAQAAAGASVCFFLLFSGNIILYHLIPSYWIWMYWFNPLAWALRSAMLNEFHSHYNDAQAHIKLSAFQMEKFDKEYIWIGIAVLFLYYVFFIFLQSLALHFIRFEKKVRLTHEDMADEMKSTASVAEVTLKVANTGKYVRTMDKPGKAAEIGFVPAYLCVRNLSYFVPNPAGEGELQLLHNVTAHFEPGYMTALMGQTGAGKTTLMDVVAGRKTGGRIEGDILVNGLLKDPQTFSRVAGYCEQMDIHSYGATVYEALVFSANLRLPHETSKQSRLDIVQDTIQLLELEPIQHHMVGKNSSDGLSVEQRKRLTIGVELVANPSILFLDEPTSGLDSRSAQIVMRGVQSIARSGRTVVCTIHQPSVQIFELFDRLLLLKAGGFTAYYGPLGEDSRDMLTYFSSIPGTVKIQPRYNPATYMLEVIGAGIGRDTGETKDYSEAYRNSELYRENEAKTLSYCEPRPEFQKFPVMKPIATDCMTQIKELAKKTGLTYWRTPEYNFMRLMAYPIFAVVFGTTFYQMKNETDKNISSQVGLIYNCMDFIGVINLMTVVETTCAERAVYYRERMSNYYGALPYSLSLFFAEVPYLFTVSMIFVSSMYFLIGLDASAVIFFRFWVAFFLYVSVCTFAGQWMSCLMPNEKVAVVAVGALSAILNLLSGYLVPFKLMRTGFSWISHIFPSRYSFTALVSQQLSRCSDKGTEPGCKLIKVTGLNGISTNQRTADFVSNTYRISMQHVTMNYVALIIIILFLQVAIFLTLKYVSHLKR